MKTLIISLRNDYPISTAGDLVVYSYDFLNDLIYEVSNEIAGNLETDFSGDKNSLLLEYAKDKPSQYQDFINLLKSELLKTLSEDNIQETLTLPFPEGYVDWLRYNTNPQFVQIGKSIIEHNYILKINPREVYEDYFLNDINPAIISLLKEYEDIKFLTVPDNDNLNFVIFRDLEQSLSEIKSLSYSDGLIQKSLGLAYYHGLGTEKDYNNALNHFRNAIGSDDADSFAFIGQMYEYGHGVEQDSNAAFQYYEESSDKNSLIGRSMLGRAFRHGVGTMPDCNKAMEYFLPAAEKGIVTAQEGLADIYFEGLVGEPNLREAFRWYSMIANNGPSIKSLYRLGKMLYEGTGTEKNYTDAYKYLKKAAEHNFEDACFLCGQILENKETEINDSIDPIQYYNQGADAGEYKAATEYAVYLKTNNEFSNAESLLKLGVEKGYAKAQYELALLLTESLNENFSESIEKSRDELLSLAVAQQYQLAVNLNKEIKLQKENLKQKEIEKDELLKKTQIEEENQRKEKTQRLTKEFILMVQTNRAIEKLYEISINPNLTCVKEIIELLKEPVMAGYPYAKAYMGLVQLLIDPTNTDALNLIESSLTLKDNSNIYGDFLTDANDETRKENEKTIRDNFSGIKMYLTNLWNVEIDIEQHFRSLYDKLFCFDECNIILAYCYLRGLGVKKSIIKAMECFDMCKRLDEFTNEPQYDIHFRKNYWRGGERYEKLYDIHFNHLNHWKEKDSALFETYKISDILGCDPHDETYNIGEEVKGDFGNMKLQNKYIKVKKLGVDFHNRLRLINDLVHDLRDLKNVGLLREESIEQFYYSKIPTWQPANINFPSMSGSYLKLYRDANEYRFIENNQIYKIKTKFNGPSNLVEKVTQQLRTGDSAITLTKDNNVKNITNSVLENGRILKEEFVDAIISADKIQEDGINLDISTSDDGQRCQLFITISVAEKPKECSNNSQEDSTQRGNLLDKDEIKNIEVADKSERNELSEESIISTNKILELEFDEKRTRLEQDLEEEFKERRLSMELVLEVKRMELEQELKREFKDRRLKMVQECEKKRMELEQELKEEFEVKRIRERKRRKYVLPHVYDKIKAYFTSNDR